MEAYKRAKYNTFYRNENNEWLATVALASIYEHISEPRVVPANVLLLLLLFHTNSLLLFLLCLRLGGWQCVSALILRQPEQITEAKTRYIYILICNAKGCRRHRQRQHSNGNDITSSSVFWPS